MAGKARKHHQPSGDNQEGSGEVAERVEKVDERSLLEMFIATQNRKDDENRERLLQAEKREEKRATEAKRERAQRADEALAAEDRAREETVAAEKRARKESIAAEERAEKRRLTALVAAEEREDLRRERAKIADEERAEARSIAKAKRREEEAMRLEDKRREELERLELASREKEEAARQAAERMLVLQEEASKRAYLQQQTLVELQAELGEKAAEAQRQESQRAKKRDRAVAGIPNHQRGEDVEDFLITSERKLRAGEIPEGEWLTIIASKLGGEVGTSWQELCLGSDVYQEVRSGLLKGYGYTTKAAGEAYHAFRTESLRGMAADQVYRKGAQLLKRMVAPRIIEKELEFDLVKPWVWACVGKRARAVLDARVVENVEDLVKGLQDYLASDGDKVAGKTAVFGTEGTGFKRQAYNADSGSDRRKGGALGSSSVSSLKCFKCGKIGHKAAECWQGERGSPGAKTAEGTSTKIVCYVCGIEGHKSTSCPGKKETQKGAVAKPVRQLRLKESRDTIIEGVVNGQGATLLLDSGAHITVVPEAMVEEGLKTGESVVVRPFRSKTPMRLPTARIKFQVESMEEWEEVVALAPVERGKETEVLYGLKLRSPRGLDLVILANKMSQAEVKRVTTRAEARQEASEEKDNARVVKLERPKVKAVVADAGRNTVEKAQAVRPKGRAVDAEAVRKAVEKAQAVRPRAKTVDAEAVEKAVEKAPAVEGKIGEGEGGTAADRPAGEPKPVSFVLEVIGSEESTGEGELAEDRPVSNPEPVTQDEAVGEELPDLARIAEEEVDLKEEIEFCLRESSEGLENLEFPPVRQGPGNRAELIEEVKSDPTLEGYRELARKGEQGFLWERELLYQAKMNHSEEVVHVMVLPEKFRRRVLEMAHEGSGHLGARKVKALLKQRFVWPGMGIDVITHSRSCEVCQRCAKGGCL